MAQVSLAVNLPGDVQGTHMSRFMEQLSVFSKEGKLSYDIRSFLEKVLEVTEAQEVYAEFVFDYFVEKSAPVTGKSAPMAYQITLKPSLRNVAETTLETESGPMTFPADEIYEIELGVAVLAANCCPCSKAISSYGAHNQRIHLRANFWLEEDTDFENLPLEDLITRLEEAASISMYPILKRPDEKHVTEQGYDNPKFSEDVARNAVENLASLQEHGIMGYELEVEAEESIHTHNAFVKLEHVFDGA